MYTIEFIDNLYCVFDSNKNLVKKFTSKARAFDFVEYIEYFELMKILMFDY
jgi:hypothetical protein